MVTLVVSDRNPAAGTWAIEGFIFLHITSRLRRAVRSWCGGTAAPALLFCSLLISRRHPHASKPVCRQEGGRRKKSKGCLFLLKKNFHCEIVFTLIEKSCKNHSGNSPILWIGLQVWPFDLASHSKGSSPGLRITPAWPLRFPAAGNISAVLPCLARLGHLLRS